MHKQSILFVCMGNICRSPMAEGIMQHLLVKHGLDMQIYVDSAGTIGYHQGELPDARMRKHAAGRGYDLSHRSRPVTTDDFDRFDLIIGMDDNNIAFLDKLAPSSEARMIIRRMTDYCTQHEADHIPDPYYGGSKGFDLVIDLLEDACANLLKEIGAVSFGLSHNSDK